MSRHGKNWRSARDAIDRNNKYSLEEAVSLIKQNSGAKFPESVDIAVRLGVDPRKADQNIRGSVVLPKGTGKKVRVLIFARGEKEKEALDAGADYVGAEDMVQKIQGGWMEFDRVVATPDMMGQVGKLGKILGPRGLMPNPKIGTVTFDLSKAMEDIKAGKVEFRVDKVGIVHASVGKVDFSQEDLCENINAFLGVLNRMKPSSSKGQFVRSMALSSTMGVGVRVAYAH